MNMKAHKGLRDALNESWKSSATGKFIEDTNFKPTTMWPPSKDFDMKPTHKPGKPVMAIENFHPNEVEKLKLMLLE